MTGGPLQAPTAGASCRTCGGALTPDGRFCVACGTPAPLRCPSCGGALTAGDRFCATCGTAAPTSPAGAQGPSTPSGVPQGEASSWQQVQVRLQQATLGEFEILRELGRGGMATVFLAHEIALNRRVAIKVMSPALLAGEGMVDRFRQEAVTIANLRHANIVSVHFVRIIDELHFFVMQFVEGRSLDAVLREHGTLPIPLVKAILFQVGSALTYAHRRGVTHRDIKPANILLDTDGNAIVTDFGIAKVAETPGLTQTGMLIGTPTYMSPEQCYGGATTPACDQYSLGIVGYQLLTGAPPFAGSTFHIMQAHTQEPVPPIGITRPECPAGLEAAIMRMLEKDPARRWPSVAHALAALDAAPLFEGDPDRDALAQMASGPGAAVRSPILTPVSPLPSRPPAPQSSSERATLPRAVAIDIEPPPAAIEVGDSFTLAASVRTDTGTTLGGAPIRWESTNAAVVTVEAARGLVSAMSPGAAKIVATAENVRAEVTLTVAPARAATVSLAVPPEPLRVGDRVQLEITALDKHGRAIVLPTEWSSSDMARAAVSPTGVVVARAPGTVAITAVVDGVRGAATLTITAATVTALHLAPAPEALAVGETLVLSAVPLDAHDTPLEDRQITWKSSDRSVATVSSGGEVTAHQPGNVAITARCETQSATIELTVVPEAVATVAISDAPGSIRIGKKFRLRATAFDARARPLRRTVAWQSSDDAVASVSPEGLVVPGAAGRATITASVDGVAGSIELAIEPPMVVTSDPGAAPAPVRGRTWIVVGAGILALAAAGIVWRLRPATPSASATAATSLGADSSGRAPAPALVVLVISPNSASIAVGDSATLQPVFKGGTPPAGSTVAWQSLSPEVAPVSDAGLVRGLAPGTARIVATTGTQTDTATISITAARASVASLSITPGAPTVAPGATIQLAAAALDARNNTLAGHEVAWQSASPQIARVDPRTGVVTGVKDGIATISVRSEAARASVTVTVAKPAPARVVAQSAPTTTVPTAVQKPVSPPATSSATGTNGATSTTVVASPPATPPAAPPTAPAAPSIFTAARVVVGGNVSCGLAADGVLSCWGGGQAMPSTLAGLRGASKLAIGFGHRCALTSGAAYCWGANDNGQLGDGTSSSRATPTPVRTEARFTDISAGGTHTCAIESGGKALCWGANESGQLGTGSTKSSPVPVPVKGDLTFRAIAAGKSHTCAIGTDGKTYCWGDGWAGQLGNGMRQTSPEPFPVDGNPGFTKVVAGGEHTCGLTAAGRAYCWGDNRNGQLGDNRDRERTKPSEVARIPSFTDIAAGVLHTCGLTADGRVFCWGDNTKGQLGNGSRVNRSVPGEVVAEHRFESVSAGGYHTCAVTRARTVACWGDNSKGQLGDATFTSQPSPVQVQIKGGAQP